MMKALLLVGGASVAFGQGCETMITVDGANSSCTTANGCTLRAAYCRRKGTTENGTACDTSLMTCATPQCAVNTDAKAAPADYKTCSKCIDTCATLTTNASCTDAVSGQCAWVVSGCSNTPAPSNTTAPCSGTATTCTNEAGCMWISYSENLCGAARSNMGMPAGWCTPCNSTSYKDVRSALKNLAGNTCTWTKGTFANAYSLTINTIAVSTSMCDVTAANKASDEAALTTAAQKGTFANWGVKDVFETGATVTCVKASNGGAAVIPSLAISGLIVAMLA